MARWTAGAKWGEAPAPDGQRDMPLALSLSEGLGLTALPPATIGLPDYQDASVAVITFKGQGPVLQALLANFVSSVFRLKRRLNKYCT